MNAVRHIHDFCKIAWDIEIGYDRDPDIFTLTTDWFLGL